MHLLCNSRSLPWLAMLVGLAVGVGATRTSAESNHPNHICIEVECKDFTVANPAYNCEPGTVCTTDFALHPFNKCMPQNDVNCDELRHGAGSWVCPHECRKASGELVKCHERWGGCLLQVPNPQ